MVLFQSNMVLFQFGRTYEIYIGRHMVLQANMQYIIIYIYIELEGPVNSPSTNSGSRTTAINQRINWRSMLL